MATLVIVHGSFVHLGDSPGTAKDASSEYWWQPGSGFEKKITAWVSSVADDGALTPLHIERQEWSGNNSEVERRVASLALLNHLRALEARGESYCVVGHSHGGSVISAALLTAAAHNQSLPGLQRWMTVGTPFIGMRPLPRLIERLRLAQRVVLVASLMLLMMFLFYVAGQIVEPSELPSAGSRAAFAWRNIIAAVMMSVPALVFTLVFAYIDQRQLFYYLPSTVARAQAWFGGRWLSFCHANDEAVQGLKSLRSATIQLFDRGFVAHRLTLLAVIALPLTYLIVLSSPPLIRSIAGVLRTSVYKVDRYAAVADTYDAERRQLRRAVAHLRQQSIPDGDASWEAIRQQRTALKQRFPDYLAIERVLRFKEEFLERGGTLCRGEVLCGDGRDYAINSSLLFHIVTDDLTSSLINDDTRYGFYGVVARAAIPIVLVPVVFIGIALGFMAVLSWFARILSAFLARILNRITLSEIKREIYGNDISGEVAFDAGPHPAWLPKGRPYLPNGISHLLTDRADRAASLSLAKFRNAISAIAMSSGQGPSNGVVSNYLSWKELIHSTYFDLPEFQVLFARAVASQAGFAATPALLTEPAYVQAGEWLRQLHVLANTPPPTLAVASPAAAVPDPSLQDIH